MAALMNSDSVHSYRQPRLCVVEGGPQRVASAPRRRQVYLRRRIAVLAVASLAVAIVVGVAAPALSADPVDPTAGAAIHVVVAGDTLWALASSLAPERDTRDVVDDILSLNARAGTPLDPAGLRVGQRLLLPSR